MSVQIITDSASDIPRQTAEEWGIRILPLSVRFGNEEFLDSITLSPDEFYDRLEKGGILPKTSQVTPHAYEEAFREALEKGDDIV